MDKPKKLKHPVTNTIFDSGNGLIIHYWSCNWSLNSDTIFFLIQESNPSSSTVRQQGNKNNKTESCNRLKCTVYNKELWSIIYIYCGVFAPCGSFWSTETLKATAQQQWSAAEPRLASPPFPSLRSTPCIARLHNTQWIAQQWGVTCPLWRHAQQYTKLHSPACQTPAFTGVTEGSSACSVRVSVHMLVAREGSRQFAAESSQTVHSQLLRWVIGVIW
jgi:hypothetical protein